MFCVLETENFSFTRGGYFKVLGEWTRTGGVSVYSGCLKSHSVALDLAEMFSYSLDCVGDVGSRGKPVLWHMSGGSENNF